jgi:hypothetical protein
MIAAAGVDTWSVCWYVEDESPPCRALEALATERSIRSQLLPERVADHRVGWFPGNRLLFAEGHPRPGGLAPPATLPAVLDALVEGLQDRGIMPPSRRLKAKRPSVGFGGVRRLDSTVDLAFADPLEGLAALTGVAALPLPRTKTKIFREAGGRRVETVYFHGFAGKKVLGRWYDKGVESGDAARGSWVRPEDQRRWAASGRVPVDALASGSFVRDAFVQRFEPLWQASKGVIVGGVIELAKRLRELQESGEITPGQAKRIAGHLMLDTAGGHLQRPSTVRGDRADARRLGLVLADGILDEVEVDLGEVCERALDSDAWGVG